MRDFGGWLDFFVYLYPNEESTKNSPISVCCVALWSSAGADQH